MPGTCIHGFAPAECLICRTLGTPPRSPATAEAPENRRQHLVGQPLATGSPSAPARPDRVHAASPSGVPRRHRSPAGSLAVVVMALLAVGAAVWLLLGVAFAVLHVLELVAVAAGAGWVGYRIGHFRGSRRPPQG